MGFIGVGWGGWAALVMIIFFIVLFFIWYKLAVYFDYAFIAIMIWGIGSMMIGLHFAFIIIAVVIAWAIWYTLCARFVILQKIVAIGIAIFCAWLVGTAVAEATEWQWGVLAGIVAAAIAGGARWKNIESDDDD